jgi:hypothetical protein
VSRFTAVLALCPGIPSEPHCGLWVSRDGAGAGNDLGMTQVRLTVRTDNPDREHEAPAEAGQILKAAGWQIDGDWEVFGYSLQAPVRRA